MCSQILLITRYINSSVIIVYIIYKTVSSEETMIINLYVLFSFLEKYRIKTRLDRNTFKKWLIFVLQILVSRSSPKNPVERDLKRRTAPNSISNSFSSDM